MTHQDYDLEIKVLPPDKKKIKRLWSVAGILALLTVVELIIAFGVDNGVLKTTTFVVMTIIKATYIVGEFMHLRYESKSLILSIIPALIFVMFLAFVLIYEGLKIAEINL